MLNNKGFTLVEVLTTIAILAILMMVAVPNIIGVINSNKERVYINDAKKLHSLAESLVHTKSEFKPLTNDGCIKIPFTELDNGEFDSPPNGAEAYSNNSFVVVKRVVKEQTELNASGVPVTTDVVDYDYFIYLEEDRGDIKSGISFTDVDNLYKDDLEDGDPLVVYSASEMISDVSSANCSSIK